MGVGLPECGTGRPWPQLCFRNIPPHGSQRCARPARSSQADYSQGAHMRPHFSQNHTQPWPRPFRPLS